MDQLDKLRRLGINYMTKAGRDELEDWIKGQEATTTQPAVAPEPAAVPEAAKQAMMSAHALCPEYLAHPDRMKWMAEFFLKKIAAPVPPVAAVMDEREAFEAAHPHAILTRVSYDSDLYTSSITSMRWQTWQKARAAQSAPVPSTLNDEVADAHELLTKHCVAYLEKGQPMTLLARIEELYSMYYAASQADEPSAPVPVLTMPKGKKP